MHAPGPNVSWLMFCQNCPSISVNNDEPLLQYMNRRTHLHLLATLSSILAATQTHAAEFAKSAAPFIEAHCVECHDDDTHKANLRLDNLKFDPANADAARVWTKIFDKVISGEMPPKKKPRPAKDELDAVTKFLHDELHAASLAHQQKRGRVTVRRLNGVEFENSVRELVGTQVNLKDMLPEDGSAAGFDNVSAALDVSATHLLLYQRAAEKAIASAIPQYPKTPFTKTLTGAEISKSGPNFTSTLNRSCKVVGDSLVMYDKMLRFGLCASAGAPWPGRYHVQFQACAVGAEGKPVPVGYYVDERNGPVWPVLREIRELQPGKPKVYDFEVDLRTRETFVVDMLANLELRSSKSNLDEYKGPGFQVDWLKIEGPIGDYPPASYGKLFGDLPLVPRSTAELMAAGKPAPPVAGTRSDFQIASDPLVPFSKQPKEDADKLIRSFMQRAIRHPVSEEQQQHLVQLVHAKLDGGFSFYDAMMFGYKVILTSADFLFVIAPTASDAKGDLPTPTLDDFQLAERLSYFLTSSPPDADLLAAARKGGLSTADVLRAQTERLLNSPKAQRFIEDFTGQWLDLRKMESTTPDPRLFGEFDYLLLWSMPRETQLFFEEVLRHDLPLTNFVQSDWTMLNERLAALYGIEGIEGIGFRKVKLPPASHRGGVMTQASVLKVTADGTRTSPVLRGKWVLERIIGKPPQPPPPDAPSIDPDIRGATTIRQQLDKHRNIPACASCHVHIDPPGFALETFDPIGNYRDFYRVATRPDGRAKPIDIHAHAKRTVYRGLDVEKGFKTAEGREFKDIEEYKAILVEDKDQLARNLVEKIIVYSTGADIQFADREVVEQIVAKLRAKNYGFRSLIHEVIQSRVFLNK